jgi:hypothetical protein
LKKLICYGNILIIALRSRCLMFDIQISSEQNLDESQDIDTYPSFAKPEIAPKYGNRKAPASIAHSRTSVEF